MNLLKLLSCFALGSGALLSAQDNNTLYGNAQQAPVTNNQAYGMSDQDIGDQIRDEVSSGLFSKGFQNVSFDVMHGIVTLKGSVDSIDSKNKLDERVRKIDGVKQINNQLTIAKEDNSRPYQESELQNSERKHPNDTAATADDRQLNAKIRDKLSDGWFTTGYETLIIRTNNGIVTITGPVKEREDLEKINEKLKSIEGIKSINNQANVENSRH